MERPEAQPDSAPKEATPPDLVSARLVVVAGRDAGREFTVASEGALGRSSNAAVGLTDADVSRRHARVYADAEGRHWVEDLGSRNGTFVNGARISRIRLEYGDKIRLGRWTVLLLVQHDAIEDQLLTRQRLEAVGRLALGIAHDFNNMVSALTTSLDFVTSGPPTTQSQGEVDECLDDMQAATTRAAALAARLLRAARRESGPHVEVDLTALCEEVVQIARRTLERDIEIETNIATGIAVRGDPTALHQALMNLCLNARDAMPEGGKLSVSAQAGAAGDRARGWWSKTIQTSGGGAGPHATPAPGRQVTVTVKDTGVGIEPQTVPRVFEPFFTTKADGVGFGVGLASVKEIVTRHGGSVQVDSHIGQGTTFEVILPLAAATGPSAGPAPAPPDRRPVPLGTRILLADDENVVRRSLVRVLRQAGYLVLEATDGEEAVRVWTEADPKPDLALFDIDMPNLDGVSAYKQLRTRCPTLPAVFLTGHKNIKRERELRAAGAWEVLIKPQPTDVILRTVTEALAQTSGDGDLWEETGQHWRDERQS